MNNDRSPGSEKAWNMNSLGLAYSRRFELSADLNDLNNAIHYGTLAINSTDDLEYKAGFLGNLGGYLQTRYMVYKNEQDLKKAFEYMKEAVNLCRIYNKAFLVDALIGLAGIYYRFYYSDGDAFNLQEGIKCLNEADTFNTEDAKKISIITPLAEHYIDYYQVTGDSESLQYTIDIVAQVADLIDKFNIETDEKAQVFLSGLGSLYLNLYNATGNIDYLQSAIDIYRKAIKTIKTDSITKMSLLANLGSMYAIRAELTGIVGDTVDARIALLEVIHFDEEHGLEVASHYQKLAHIEKLSFRIWGDKSSIQNSVEAARKSIKLTSDSSPDLPIYLNFLGITLLDFIAVSNEKNNYFKEAIDAISRCRKLTPENSYLHTLSTENLGYALAYRYKVNHDLNDLSEALSYYEVVLKKTSSSSPDRFSRELNYSLALEDYAKHTEKKSDWMKAFLKLDEVWAAYDNLFFETPMSFRGSAQQKHLHFQLNSVDMGIMILSKKINLSSAERKDIICRTYLFAEGSKARIVNAMLGRTIAERPKAPMDLIRQEEELHQKLMTIDRLEYIFWERTIKEDQSMKRIHTRTTTRSAILKQLNEVWTKIEKVSPSAAEFISIRRGIRPNQKAIVNLANQLKPNEAYLSLFITRNRSVFFLMRSNWDAPKMYFNEHGEKGWDQSIMDLESEVLRKKGGHYYWHTILSDLFAKAKEDLENIDTIIISPHRYGNNIPWSAIPINGSFLGSEYEIVITPSMAILERIRSNAHSQKNGSVGALVVGDPQDNLKFARKEAETISKLLAVKPLIGSHATKSKALEMLSKVGLAHFAAHSSSHILDPLFSSIELVDEKLTASDILDKKVQLELLVASACRTGISGNFGGDENIGLGQAFLMSGAKSVIVSLWNIEDEASSFFMESFYREYLKGASKSKSLKSAINKVRENARWNKPYYWAPFILIGSWE